MVLKDEATPVAVIANVSLTCFIAVRTPVAVIVANTNVTRSVDAIRFPMAVAALVIFVRLIERRTPVATVAKAFLV